MVNKKKLFLLCSVIAMGLVSIHEVSAYNTYRIHEKNNLQINNIRWTQLYKGTQEYDKNNNPMGPAWGEYFYTIDLAPYIDKYGIGKTYQLEFDGKAEKAGPVAIRLLNGAGSRYVLEKVNDKVVGGQYDESTETWNSYASSWETQYKHYSLKVKFDMYDENTKEARLSFCSKYGTGIYPIVKNIKISVAE